MAAAFGDVGWGLMQCKKHASEARFVAEEAMIVFFFVWVAGLTPDRRFGKNERQSYGDSASWSGG